MNIPELNHLIAKGRIKAIVKEVGQERFLVGFERINRRSRKNHVKHFIKKPINLNSLSKDAQQTAQQPSV